MAGVGTKGLKRAYGVLVRRFLVLDTGMQLWLPEHITQLIATCLIFHNMLVEEQVADLYDPFDIAYEGEIVSDNEPVPQTVTQQQLQVQEHELVRCKALLATHHDNNQEAVDLKVCMARCCQLYYSKSMLALNQRYLCHYD